VSPNKATEADGAVRAVTQSELHSVLLGLPLSPCGAETDLGKCMPVVVRSARPAPTTMSLAVALATWMVKAVVQPLATAPSPA
jgi:hypothetical protein